MRRPASTPRLVLVLLASAALGAISCSSRSDPPVRTEQDAAARIDSATALNARSGTYRVPGTQVTLMKVVSLPDDQLGLWFSFAPRAADCCSLFPRVGLESSAEDASQPYRTIVIPATYVPANGSLPMRLFDRDARKVHPFTVDLGALGVPSDAW